MNEILESARKGIDLILDTCIKHKISSKEIADMLDTLRGEYALQHMAWEIDNGINQPEPVLKNIEGMKNSTRYYLRDCLEENIHPDLIESALGHLVGEYIVWYNEKHKPLDTQPLDEIEAHIRHRFEDLKRKDTDSALLHELLDGLAAEYHTYQHLEAIADED